MTIVVDRRAIRRHTARTRRKRRASRPAPEPLARFRLYPEARRGLYVAVVVWPSLAALRRATRALGDREWRTTAGFCSSYDRFRIRPGCTPRRLPDFATVHLATERLSMRIVTHELLHAAVAWARRIGFRFVALGGVGAEFGSEGDGYAVSDDEERLCRVYGDLCREFMVKAERAGLYRGGP